MKRKRKSFGLMMSVKGPLTWARIHPIVTDAPRPTRGRGSGDAAAGSRPHKARPPPLAGGRGLNPRRGDDPSCCKPIVPEIVARVNLKALLSEPGELCRSTPRPYEDRER